VVAASRLLCVNAGLPDEIKFWAAEGPTIAALGRPFRVDLLWVRSQA
jgi:hypothetical protein